MKSSAILSFSVLSFIAFFLEYVPLIHWPFSWLMTYFHEISHGLVALITGGDILYIQLDIKGSGLCVTMGGNQFLISLSGYLGAIIWGYVIFRLACHLSLRQLYIFIICLGVLCGLTLVFWSRGLLTVMILSILSMFIFFIGYYQRKYMSSWIIKLLGLYILFDAIRAPFHLLDGRHVGDAAKLQNITNIPEFLWVFLWVITGFVFLYKLFKLHAQKNST